MKRANLPHSPRLPQSSANLRNPEAEALHCCQTIQKLANVLQGAGRGSLPTALDSLAVSNAGYLIGREIETLRHLLPQIRRSHSGASATSDSGKT